MLIKGLDGASRGWLWFCILLTPILALAGGMGFQIVGFGLGVSAMLVWAADRTSANYLRALWPVLLIVFVGWAWLSTLWSDYEGKAFGGNALTLFVLAVALLFAPLIFIRLSDAHRRRLGWAVIWGSMIGVMLLFAEAISDFAITLWADPADAGESAHRRLAEAEMNLGRGQVSYMQLFWPIAILMMSQLKRGWILAIGCALVLLISAEINNLSIIFPTLILSTAIVGLAAWRPKWGLCLAFLLAVVSLVFAPVLGWISSGVDAETLSELPLSWEHRLRMWIYSWELIQQHLFIGHGFDASRVYEELTFHARDGRDIVVMSMHPHNIGLHIWLETGIVGVILASGFVISTIKPVLKFCCNKLRKMAAAGVISVAATSGVATVGVWQHWWWALVMLSVCSIVLVPHKSDAVS